MRNVPPLSKQSVGGKLKKRERRGKDEEKGHARPGLSVGEAAAQADRTAADLGGR